MACGVDDPSREVRSGASRTTPDPASVPAAVGAINAFGTDLYRAYQAPGRGNYVLSPYVVARTLAMNRAGATGATRAQFDKVLHAESPQFDRGLATLTQVLPARNGDRRTETRKGTIQVSSAASVWAPRGTKLAEPYLDTLSAQFDSGVRVVDFRSDPESARNAVNGWARNATDGNVTELLPRGVITDVTSLLDASALYLRAPWEVPLQPSATPLRFTTADDQAIDVRAMRAVIPTSARYARGDRWQAVELPYLGRELSMVVVVPEPGTFESFESGFDGARLDEVVGALRPSPVELRLPRFAFQTDARLDSPLQAMGLPSAFNDREADFAPMTSDDENLALTAFVHQSYVDASENGSGAQSGSIAVSGTEAVAPADAVSLTVDRPFLVLVRDRQTGLVISIGRVVNPNG